MPRSRPYLTLTESLRKKALYLVGRFLDDPRVPDHRLSSLQAWWWFRGTNGAFVDSKYSTFTTFLSAEPSICEKWKRKACKRGNAWFAIIDESTGSFINRSIGKNKRKLLPCIRVIDKLRIRNAELLLAPPADLVSRLLNNLTGRERQVVKLADRLILAGVKRPSHQNECYNAATLNRTARFCRKRFAEKAAELRKMIIDDEVNGTKECKGFFLTAGQYPARCANGLLDIWNKIDRWYEGELQKEKEKKKKKKKRVKPGLKGPQRMLLFLEMLDRLDEKLKTLKPKLSKPDLCQELVEELAGLKIGYGAYCAPQAVRSAMSISFPSTVQNPQDELSKVSFRDVVALQPDEHEHGKQILRVMGDDVSVGEVGMAYGLDGWLVICMCCVLKSLSASDLSDAKLAHLERLASEFKQVTGFTASPRVFKSWLNIKGTATCKWRGFIYGAGMLATRPSRTQPGP